MPTDPTPETHLQAQNTVGAAEEGSEIDPIRTETIFSRMPLHILSKSGSRPQINIEKRFPDGKLEERWKVSYNEAYGPARQLAYDLHTLIIERAIEEAFEESRRAKQSFPRLIRLSSLNDIAKQLGLAERDTNSIKQALSQNAGILISALKRYRGNDGVEYTLEGVFSPYGIFFSGQKLPTGQRAAQVYINLNDAYFEAWSKSVTRPLDYNYKALLPPIPRRFYELISYAIYGAIKNGHPTARYRYSEFCRNAPQLRYDTFRQVKKQMYKIHKPHLENGYIVTVKFESTTDELGRADWWMTYTPGPRASAEFAVFTGKKARAIGAPATAKLGAGERAKTSPSAKNNPPRQPKLNLEPEINQEYIAALSKRGVRETSARKELATLPANFPLLDLLEWADGQLPGLEAAAARRGETTNPPGFYISLIRDRTAPPASFLPTRVRKQQEEANLRKQMAILEEEERLRAQEEAERQAALARVDRLQSADPSRYRTLYDQAKRDLISISPSMAKTFKLYPNSPMYDESIRHRMQQLMTEKF